MTVRLAQAALALAVVIVPLAAYALSAEVRAEVGRVFAMLAAGDTAGLRAYVLAYGAWAPAVSIGLMVLQALAAPVPHFVVIFANGLAFGVAKGWLLSLIGQTVAASVCFAIARGLGRAPVEALVGRFGLELADRWFARWGIAGIFATRLVPGVGFDAISYASGLTGIGYGRFALVTVVGSAPQTFSTPTSGRPRRRTPGSPPGNGGGRLRSRGDGADPLAAGPRPRPSRTRRVED
jgi:uncharacterized membrane protein YdjX (TVP38/TMEM64 family)